MSRLSVKDLEDIRLRDSAVTVYSDRFGGQYVLNKDGRSHGQHAIMDRRRLLEHVGELDAERERMVCRVPADMVVTPEAAERTLKDFKKLPGHFSVLARFSETGWVVEAPELGGTGAAGEQSQYLCVAKGEKDARWTTDPRSALRFAREDDVRAWMSLSALSTFLIRPRFFEWETPCSS